MMKNEAEKKQSAVVKRQAKEEMEQDLLNYDIIRKILAIYVECVAIPSFKKRSSQRYMVAMGEMCKAEVSNATAISDTWAQFKKLIDSYNIH